MHTEHCCLSVGDILKKRGTKRTFRTVTAIESGKVKLKKPNGTPCALALDSVFDAYDIIGHETPLLASHMAFPARDTFVCPHSACDAHMVAIQCGDFVLDSFGSVHRVAEIIATDSNPKRALLVCDCDSRLIAGLTSRVPDDIPN